MSEECYSMSYSSSHRYRGLAYPPGAIASPSRYRSRSHFSRRYDRTVLHNQRNNLARLEAREAEGESFWSETFLNSFRVRLIHLMRDLGGSQTITVVARKEILIDEGVFFLVSEGYADAYDFEQYVLNAEDRMMPTVIEAWSQTANDPRRKSHPNMHDTGELFDKAVNEWLTQSRISFELIRHEMVPFSSRELHVEVVAPALQLLSVRADWLPVETAYRGALVELSRGAAANAVTDAGTALQEAFTVLGCDGNSLGGLIKSARKKEILNAHDLPMLDAIERIAQWVSADRSITGDSHNAKPAEVDDAWLTVHVVGALLLRLSKQLTRS